MDKTIDAVKMPTPNGVTPIFISKALTAGTNIKILQNPYITDGIPAKSSVTLFNTDDKMPSLKYSPRKIEIEKENGIEIISAINDVIKVPMMNGNEPNSLSTGSHLLPYKKLNPKDRIAGNDLINKVKNIANNKNSIETPER